MLGANLRGTVTEEKHESQGRSGCGGCWGPRSACSLTLFSNGLLHSHFLAIGFAALAFAIMGLYVLHKGWEMAVARMVDSEHLAEQGLPTGESTPGIL